MITEGSIRRLNRTDLIAISNIHKNAFPESAVTKIGLEAIYRYYDWLLTGPHPEAVIIGIEITNKLVGFLFGGRFNKAVVGFLRQNKLYLSWRILTRPWLLMNPIFIERFEQLLKLFLFSKKTKEILPSDTYHQSFGILAIAIDHHYRGKGIGKLLMEEADRQAQIAGFTQMHLTVDPNNRRAVAFYKRIGWKRQLQSGRWQGKMIKTILSDSLPND